MIRRAIMLASIVISIAAGVSASAGKVPKSAVEHRGTTRMSSSTGRSDANKQTDLKVQRTGVGQHVLLTPEADRQKSDPVPNARGTLLGDLFTPLLTLLGVMLGGVLGYWGSLRVANHTIEANRQKDNFQIRKDLLETSIRSLGSLKRACDSFLVIGFMEETPDTMTAQHRQLISGIYDVLVETPWVFPQSIEEKGRQLKKNLRMLEAFFNDKVRPLLGQDIAQLSTNAREASHAIRSDTDYVKSWAEKELNQLNVEYKTLIEHGIPK